ncbi:HK97 family phage prohead protease [Rhizobium sp.]
MDRLFFETKIDTGDDGEVTGIAWKFGSPDRVGDVIEKGAFGALSLPLPMLFGHDPNDPVGIWTAAQEDAEGLQIKGNLLVKEVARAREVFALVKAGAVKALSVGFQTLKAAPRTGGGRVISSAKLMEVSLVTFGMHPGARVTSAKSLADAVRIAEAINRASTALSQR